MDTKTPSIWCISPKTNKPKLMDVQSTPQRNLITWDVDTTQGGEVASVMKYFYFMNEVVVKCIEDKLVETFHEYFDARRLYEEEIKLSHVYKVKIQELE